MMKIKIHVCTFRRFKRICTVLRKYSQTSDECNLRQNVNSSHCYRELFPWKTLSEFNKHIEESIVFNIGGIYAINKPYGVAIRPFHVQGEGKPITRTLRNTDVGETHFTIEASLPHLRHVLNEKNLSIVKSTERFSSGLVLLAANDAIKGQIRKEFLFSKSLREPIFTYLCVVLGTLGKQEFSESVGITKMAINDCQFQPSILTSYCRRKLQSGIIKSAHTAVRTIKSNLETNASLLSISSTQLKWNFIRVYAAFKGAGILGDNLYAPRVRRMCGKPISISVHNTAAHQPLTLNGEIVRRLLRSDVSISNIPIHMHLVQVRLKKSNIRIDADPPEYFKWSCRQLNLLE